MVVACPCLYEETSFLAFSRPEEETKRVLRDDNNQLSSALMGDVLADDGYTYHYHTMVWWRWRPEDISHLGSDISADCLRRPM